MNEKSIKINFTGESKAVTFGIDDTSTYKINVFQMNNLKYWLQDQSSSIIITCDDGSEVALNKYSIQYANIFK